MKSMASATYDGARAATLRHATVAKKDHIISISYEGTSPLTVDLVKWSAAAIDSMSLYQDSISQLLPPNILLTDFPFDRLTDNFSYAAIFKQPDNAKWLDPFRENIRSQIFHHFCLHNGKGINRESCQRWLEAGQTAMQHLAVTCALTFGISPQQHHYRMFYDSTPLETRGIWLLQNRLLIWTNPMARPKEEDLLPTAYIFPSLIAPTLMFEITILRPIACQIIQYLSLDDSFYSFEYWVHYRLKPHGKRHWTGPEISKPVEQFTSIALGRALSPRWIRQLLRSIFCHFFPDLIERSHNSVVDKAAQHTRGTSLAHYGRLASFPPLRHTRFNQTPKFVLQNHMWHAILGLEKPTAEFHTRLKVLDLAICYPWSSDGLQAARAALHFYINLSDTAMVSQRLQHLFQTYGPLVSSPSFVLNICRSILV
jgi:hypothetical protein